MALRRIRIRIRIRNGRLAPTFGRWRMSMHKVWLTLLVLGAGCPCAGCAPVIEQPDGGHALRGPYVGGGGGYGIR